MDQPRSPSRSCESCFSRLRMTTSVQGENLIGVTRKRYGNPRYSPVRKRSCRASIAARAPSSTVTSSKKSSNSRCSWDSGNTTRPSFSMIANAKSVGNTGRDTDTKWGVTETMPWKRPAPSWIGVATAARIEPHTFDWLTWTDSGTVPSPLVLGSPQTRPSRASLKNCLSSTNTSGDTVDAIENFSCCMPGRRSSTRSACRGRPP